MGRIPAVPAAEAGVLGRLVYRIARRRFGDVPEPFAVTRHHRRLFWAGLVAGLGYEQAARVLPARLREVAVYRVATVVGCSWCVDFGTMLQRLDGLDVDRLEHIAEHATHPLYAADERLALAYADAENMRARFNHALGITDQGFDAACTVRLTPAAASASPG